MVSLTWSGHDFEAEHPFGRRLLHPHTGKARQGPALRDWPRCGVAPPPDKPRCRSRDRAYRRSPPPAPPVCRDRPSVPCPRGRSTGARNDPTENLNARSRLRHRRSCHRHQRSTFLRHDRSVWCPPCQTRVVAVPPLHLSGRKRTTPRAVSARPRSESFPAPSVRFDTTMRRPGAATRTPFRRSYDTTRPHSALPGATPAEAYEKGLPPQLQPKPHRLSLLCRLNQNTRS